VSHPASTWDRVEDDLGAGPPDSGGVRTIEMDGVTVYAFPTMVLGEEPIPPPKRGGPERCPRPCVECSDGSHHFSDAMIDFASEDDEDEALSSAQSPAARAEMLHPAEIAGCDVWRVCKHCDAWQEYTDDCPDGGEDDFGQTEGLDDPIPAPDDEPVPESVP
jgi:hypothetical protein